MPALALALTALLCVGAVPSPGTPTIPAELRIIRSVGHAPRYVRLRSRRTSLGVSGEQTRLIDLETGRYVDRVAAGVLSHAAGFDGNRVWSADVTGMPLIEGNADTRLDVMAEAHLFGRRGPERPQMRLLRSTPHELVVRSTYRGLSAPIDVTVNRKSGLVSAVRDDTGGEPTRIVYSDYRRVGNLVVPFSSVTITRYGITRESVHDVETTDRVGPGMFAQPPEPNDVQLSGSTAVPMSFRDLEIGVPVRIDDGPPLHMLLDSGSSNYLTITTARRLHVRTVGKGKSGGVGANLVTERYTTVKRLRIGSAVLRDQPFSVLDDKDLAFDGTIGCELFQRLAVRLDFRNRLVRLARRARDLGVTAAPIPMRLAQCTPEIDGAVDEMHGALAIDTGSSESLDVFSPFVRRHHLVARYHGIRAPSIGGGIGGDTQGYLARARVIRLGPIRFTGVTVILDDMASGALSDPTELGLVGLPLLWRCDVTLEYRAGRMWLRRCRG
jgi:Aspartyl protease